MNQPIGILRIAAGVALGLVLAWLAIVVISMLFGLGLFSMFAGAIDSAFTAAPASRSTASAMPRLPAGTAVRDFRNDARRRREQTPVATQYWAECETWSQHYQQTPVETVRLQAKFHCDRYSRYIETGVPANGPAPLLETR